MRTTHTLTENWFVKQIDDPDVEALIRELLAPDESWLSSRMPAQVHDVLLAHGEITDPHVGKHAASSAWVGDQDWAYGCRFDSTEQAGGPVFLRLDGIDTLADAYLNGVHIGEFDNMFRSYAVDIEEHLSAPGSDNVLLIIFHSATRFIDQPRDPVIGVAKQKYLRKAFNDFSSYLGARPHSIKVGIFRDVLIDVPDRAWIENVCVRTELTEAFSRARIHVMVETGGTDASLQWVLAGPDGSEMKRGTVDDAQAEFEITVENPALWWPWTHGKPNLYALKVRIVYDDEVVDERSETFGIREVRRVTEDPETGEPRFKFVVNGTAIFLRGANWAPVEGSTHCWREDRAIELLDRAEQSHINALRVWGGCDLPDRAFYDACDRRGILVWQDFMFGYGIVPIHAPGFLDNCREEIAGVVRQLRNHPCIFMWAGGNENHMGYDFSEGGAPETGHELFEEVMPEICRRHDPTRPFHPSSPFGGRAPNWPLSGDWHDYTTITFSPEASVPLYASEIGRVSAPSLSSMRRFMREEELWPTDHDPAIRAPGQPAWPPMWQYRSVDGSWDKIGAIEEFCDPATAEDLIRVLGTAHGEYLQQRIERLRRGVPDGTTDGNRRCWGTMPWRLNDSWPIIYWSVVDYYLQPKIPYYFLKRAYETVLVCFEQTPDRVCVWVINDGPDDVEGTLTVRHRRLSGETRNEMTVPVVLAPGESRRCLDLTDFGPLSLRNEFLHARFAGHDATFLLTGERYLHLPNATLTARRTVQGIELASDAFARQVSIELPDASSAVPGDNFFDLPPGETRFIDLINSDGSEVVINAVNSDTVRIPV